MAIQNWSENIVIVELQDDPAFSDDLSTATEMLSQKPDTDAILDFSAIRRLNSSNLAQLLRLRKVVAITNRRKLKLCSLDSHVWGVFLVTGLDKLFEVADNVATGLASIQIER